MLGYANPRGVSMARIYDIGVSVRSTIVLLW